MNKHKGNLIFALGIVLVLFLFLAFVRMTSYDTVHTWNTQMQTIANGYQTKHPDEKVTRLDSNAEAVSLPANVTHVVYVGDSAKIISVDTTDATDAVVNQFETLFGGNTHMYIFSKQK